jgi:hypothetical protein
MPMLLPRGFLGGDERERTDRGADRRGGKRALQNIAPREATRDDLAHGRVGGHIARLAIGVLELDDTKFMTSLIDHLTASAKT